MGYGNGNKTAAVVGTIPKVAKPGHREDFILRVLHPSKRYPEPKVELKVYVNNTTSNPPFEGLSTRGGYFLMSLEQFNKLANMRDQVAEAVRAVTLEEGVAPQEVAVPDAPNLALLGGVVAGTGS